MYKFITHLQKILQLHTQKILQLQVTYLKKKNKSLKNETAKFDQTYTD